MVLRSSTRRRGPTSSTRVPTGSATPTTRA
nr:MAG TPA: hypothetical protein [Caudoviricetes sp.]